MPDSLAQTPKAATKTEQGEALEAKCNDLRDTVTVPWTQLNDTQQEQDYWREQAVYFTRLLADARPHSGVFARLLENAD